MLKIWRPSLALEFLIPYIWGWPKNPYCYQSGHVILWFILRLENEWANHFYPWTTSSSWQFVLREPSFCRSPHLPAPCSSSPPAFFPVRGTLSPGLRGGGGGAVGPWMEEKRGPWEEGLLEDAEVNCPFLTTLHRASAVQSEDPVIWNKSGLSGAYCLQQGLTILLKKKKKSLVDLASHNYIYLFAKFQNLSDSQIGLIYLNTIIVPWKLLFLFLFIFWVHRVLFVLSVYFGWHLL